MRYLALACDYDGTLATRGEIDPATIAALERCRETGRRVLLVTGRELDDLARVCPRLDLFDWVVAENGALLYRPQDKEERVLGERPPDDFINALGSRGVAPMSTGRVIVAAWEPHEKTVLETIRDFGLELQVIFNKGAVMVLPTGINKATGLNAALLELGLSRHNVVGVGDAENDHAFIDACEASAAVANALPLLKQRADIVLERDHGAGVTDLIESLIRDDLASLAPALTRHHLLLGHTADNHEVAMPPYGSNFLVAGKSGSGKSTLATAFVERLHQSGYQFCIIDPEGDYDDFLDAVTIGGRDHAPNEDDLLRLLEDPRKNAVVSLLGLAVEGRPSHFLKILSRLQELRARLGRPHWIIIDEAHHVLPANYEPSALALPQRIDRALFITLEPGWIAPEALAQIGSIVAVGDRPVETLREFADLAGHPPPAIAETPLPSGEALYWSISSGDPPARFKVARGQTERRRHNRKYAQGELDVDRSFYFRGPQAKLKLRAQNLAVFLQLVEGVDDDTWLYHLARQDYSRWFRDAIKDDELADAVDRIETAPDAIADDSRRQIRDLLAARYALPDGLLDNGATSS